MPKAEWGTKRVCPETGRRFYDLGRDPVISPYTGEVVELDTGVKTRVAVSVKSDDSDDDALTLVDDGDDSAESAGKGGVQIEDELLEDDDEDNVSLDEIADVAADEDEN
ncbi:MAG: TIGR02300 family protein [Rhodobacter sp.]|nr:TIGR02300 family protein [Rhodobacter sp.]MCY4241464.1 TIGR02300 family protein [Rhodobacter sp.]